MISPLLAAAESAASSSGFVDTAEDWIWIVIALPLFGSATILFFGKQLGDRVSAVLASTLVFISFLIGAVASLDFVRGSAEHSVEVTLWEWIPALGIDVAFLWDPLSASITAIVTGIGFVIHVFAIGYMKGDARVPRFFAYLNLFIASMLILELGANFAIMFVGWELVGLSSYLLISFWFEKPSAAAAGKKAFIVNRIGDFGFLVALMLIFASFGSLDFDVVFSAAPSVLTTAMATAITLMLFIGATGKSAQIPLYVWLVDAMEGPTPVSALIHAATMVTAGVFMVTRAAPLFELSEVTMTVVATVGALTALFAATIGIAQRDIKRVLAYSTISQLGFMVLAVGLGAYVAALFHIITHAFFKALLFLGAGSVIHSMADEQDMFEMGGLRKAMPVTWITMLVGSLALIGLPPFAGFFSKDEILASAFEKGGYAMGLWIVGLIAAIFTAFYITRLMVLTFWGEPRWNQGVHPHESPNVMTVPLIILAVGSLSVGFINAPGIFWLEHFQESVFEGVELLHPPEELGEIVLLAGIAVLGALIGMVLAYRRYTRDELPDETQGIWNTLLHGYYVDDLYGKTIVLPGKRASEALAFSVDAKVVDGAVNGTAKLVGGISKRLKPLQSGLVRSYATGILVGTFGLVLWFLVRGGI
jgi:NADH-quinone oxidoreductase subunit L